MLERIERWLLNSPLQIAEGPEAGAVAGWLDEHDRPAFAYGEITGYYLTFLAFLAAERGAGEELACRASRAVAWLRRTWAGPLPPPTRVYLAGSPSDWHNRVVFTFDLAMVLRGLATASGLLKADAWRTVASSVTEFLSPCIAADGTLLPFVLRAGPAQEIPAKWSTRPGPFQVKSAAVIRLATPCEVPGPLRAAAEATVALWYDPAVPLELAGDLHAFFYHLEGLVLWGIERTDDTAWSRAASLYAQVMAQRGAELDAEAADREGAVMRSDVLAQALRLGCVLAARGYLPAASWGGRLEGLVRALRRHVDPNGAVCFHRLGAPGPCHRNAWSAMFAYQAFWFYERWRQGSHLPTASLRLLI